MSFPVIAGFLAAGVHVLSGPDHLAAVTPLVFDSRCKHWKIGFYWGLGHVTGMILIGILFYFFRDIIPLEGISAFSEKSVGFLLTGLGIWTFYRIRNKRKRHEHPHCHPEENIVHIHEHSHSGHHHRHRHDTPSKQNHLSALGIGIVHGFAGIAHFVLFLPVLGFESKFDSLQYIAGFGLGSIITMMLFATAIGKLDRGNQREIQEKPVYYQLQFWSGIIAAGVGIFWIFAA